MHARQPKWSFFPVFTLKKLKWIVLRLLRFQIMIVYGQKGRIFVWGVKCPSRNTVTRPIMFDCHLVGMPKGAQNLPQAVFLISLCLEPCFVRCLKCVLLHLNLVYGSETSSLQCMRLQLGFFITPQRLKVLKDEHSYNHMHVLLEICGSGRLIPYTWYHWVVSEND
jgi:hypothetical protein